MELIDPKIIEPVAEVNLDDQVMQDVQDAGVMTAVAGSIGINVHIELDPNDPHPEVTVEKLMSNYQKTKTEHTLAVDVLASDILEQVPSQFIESEINGLADAFINAETSSEAATTELAVNMEKVSDITRNETGITVHVSDIATIDQKLNEQMLKDEVWTCECGRMKGEGLEGRVCPDCGTTCQHPDKPLKESEPLQDKVLPPISDYMNYEQYLNVMRETHGYEKFDQKQALQFDNAVTYRWRDIRALRLVMQNMGVKGTNPLQRFTSEYRRVYSNMEFIYLEMANLRHFLSLEIQNLNEQAKRAKKEKKTMLGTLLSTTASRIQQYTAMGSRIPISMELKETAKVSYFWQRQYQTINDGLRNQINTQTTKLKQLSDIKEPSLDVLQMIEWLQNSIRDLQTTLENSHSVLQTAADEFDKSDEA